MVQGLFIRRISRRLAEVEVSGNTFEAYISNGIEMDFLKNESVCFLRKAGNENRRSPFDLYSVCFNDESSESKQFAAFSIAKKGINAYGK